LSTGQAVGTKQSLIAAKRWLFKAAEKLRSAAVLLNLGSTRLRGEEEEAPVEKRDVCFL